MAGERLTAMEYIAGAEEAALLRHASDATLRATDALTAGDGVGSRANLDRAMALRAAVPVITAHLIAVDKIHRGLGLTPLTLESVSGFVSVGSDDEPTAIRGMNTAERDRRERELLEERCFEAAIARTKGGELVIQTWDELLRFVYRGELSEENRQRLTAELQSARESLLGKLPKLLNTDKVSDQIARTKGIVDKYRRFYESISAMEAEAGREIPFASAAIEPDAAPDLPEEQIPPTPGQELEPTGEPIDRRMLTTEAVFGLTETGDYITPTPESMALKVFEDEVAGLSSAEIEAKMLSILGRFNEYLRDLKYLLRAASTGYHTLTAIQRRQFEEVKDYIATQNVYPNDITPREMHAIADRAKTVHDLIAERLRNG